MQYAQSWNWRYRGIIGDLLFLGRKRERESAVLVTYFGPDLIS